MKRKMLFPILNTLQLDMLEQFVFANGYHLIYDIVEQKALVVDRNDKAWFVQLKDKEIFLMKGKKTIPINCKGVGKSISKNLNIVEKVATTVKSPINIVMDVLKTYGINKKANIDFLHNVMKRLDEEIRIADEVNTFDDYINDEELVTLQSNGR